MTTNKIVANALKAKNGAYDTLIIRKDSKYNNLWCIYQDGSANRAVPRVFDSPDAAKKYIKEKMPAWSDAKIKVKNSVAMNAYCEVGDYIETRGGGQATVERVVGDKVYLSDGQVIRMSDVACVLNADSVAKNADNRYETAKFGNNDVKCEIGGYGKEPGFHISIYTDGIYSPHSWGDKGKKCINEAKIVLKTMERKMSALKQAIAWMEQNAKKW